MRNHEILQEKFPEIMHNFVATNPTKSQKKNYLKDHLLLHLLQFFFILEKLDAWGSHYPSSLNNF
jgi:hypothetical protein